MEKDVLIKNIVNYAANSSENFISEEAAIYPGLAGMRIFDEPLIGFASADDELFVTEFKKEGVIHPEYLSPMEWLPGAKTVISYFLPFSMEVKKSNRNRSDLPYEPGIPQRCSAQWLHARIEGQMFLDKITSYVQSLFRGRRV